MILLGGDFNYPGIDWSTSVLTDSYLIRSFRESLVSLAHDFLLEQVNTNLTREPNVLDLCFTSHPDLTQCHTALGLSDHKAVIVDLASTIPTRRKCTKNIYYYRKADWDSICEELTHISETYFSMNEDISRTVEQNWKFFHENTLQIMQNFIPTKRKSTTKITMDDLQIETIN